MCLGFYNLIGESTDWVYITDIKGADMSTNDSRDVTLEDLLGFVEALNMTESDKELLEAATKFLRWKPKTIETIVESEEVVEESTPSVSEVTAEEPNVDKRQIFKLVEEEWQELQGGMKDLAKGDVFYMRESTGEVVADYAGCQVFVAISDPRPVVNEKNENVTGIEVAQDVRHTVDSLAVNMDEYPSKKETNE